MLRDRDSALCEKATTRQPSHFFSTFFMSELLQGGQYTFKNVERWTRARKFTGRRTGVPIDLSSMDKIFVPIHVTDAHWALLVVYCSIKKVVYYDSLRWDGTRYCEAMLQYLAQESRLKRNVSRKRVPVNISEWDHVNAGSSCPMQAKGSLDCGVFTIMCADFCFHTLLKHFCIHSLINAVRIHSLPYSLAFMHKSLFSHSEISFVFAHLLVQHLLMSDLNESDLYSRKYSERE